MASNSLTLADVPDLRAPGLSLSQQERHTIALPLTGAVFDVLVEVFQRRLVNARFIGRDLDDLARTRRGDAPLKEVQAGFDSAYVGKHDAFKAALLDARDYVGHLLAGSWRQLGWDVTYSGVAAAMLAEDLRLTAGAGRDLLSECLSWRGIAVGVRGGRPSYSERVAAERARLW